MLVRLLIIFAFVAITSVSAAREATLDDWSDAERGLINAMLIDSLGSPPPDPSNKYADNLKAAKLGEKIFHDKRFSANGAVSCANCHRVDYNFTDDLPRAQGMERSDRRSMSIMGMAYQRWFFWDGRKDSLWAQALMPVESPVEQGISRTRCTQLIFQYYRDDYQEAIGPLPDMDPFAFPPLARPDPEDSHAMEQWNDIPKETRNQITRVYVNMGKALAAFVRSLNPEAAPFDYYARALAAADEQGLESLTPRQTKGLRLFITKAKCINCHNGPLLTNGEFHHVGIRDDWEPDRGRAAVIETVSNDEFGCRSYWSDADPEKDCAHVRFLDASSTKYERAFKTPGLRGVAMRPPYMHGGQITSLSAVLRNYRDVSGKGLSDEIFHNDLTNEELGQLEAFLYALSPDL